jgi:branched-chain amino acid transport system ATP-binding protein
MNVKNRRPDELALGGLNRTFQIARHFSEMTTLDNLLMAFQQHQGESIFKSIFRFPSVKEKERKARQRAQEILDFFDLARLKDEKARNLSYGQQRLLSIAMSLMSSPELLLLDEPTAYVNPTLTERIKDYLRELNKNGLAILLIEHNMDVIMDLCKRIYVLNAGRNIAEGTPEEIRNHQAVLEAYLGVAK